MTQQLLTRAILDANVLAPGFLGAVSTSAQLIQLWRQNADELVMSEHLLGEVVVRIPIAIFAAGSTRRKVLAS
jgi:predicted nucleic acid-binding protein